jgi:hypothetical protein|tara:strand:- start:153 stop:599 length:447 start_codon:yes stop_codon:yes gene_type:complete
MKLVTIKKTTAAVVILFIPMIVLAQAMSMGNGDKNWINVEDVRRDGTILTFSEVQIDGDGWLVIHPFEDGAANGDKYIASTFLNDGTNADVDIEVFMGLAPGEMFIVMLHSDSNANAVLDFVFVDDRNVMDLAVFEGNKMIGHAIPTP